MTDFRVLCAELLGALENEGHAHWPGGPDGDPLIEQARAALAELQGKGPTIDDIWQLCADHEFHLGIDGANEDESANGLLGIVTEALARFGHPTPPPPNDLSHLSEAEFQALCPQGYHGVGDGPAVPESREPASVVDEAAADDLVVGELVSRLRTKAATEKQNACHYSAILLTRAASLLARLALQPVPVESADIRYEFSVMDGDYVEQASGSAPTLEQARDEGLHYLAQYSQDGPHTLELRRVEILPLPREVQP